MANFPQYDMASIIDHPALSGFGEFLQQEREAEAISRSSNDRFLSHEHDITLQPGSHDPAEFEARHQRRYEARTRRLGLMEAQMRTEHRQRRLFEAGFNPDPVPEGPYDDVRGIEQGRRINLRRWGPSSAALEGSCLADPEPLSAEPPRPIAPCRSQLAEQADFSELTIDWLHERFDWLQEEAEERERIKELNDDIDDHLETLADRKRDIPDIKERIQAAADAWHARDPSAFAPWMDHASKANKSSKSQIRIWQTVLFYTQDVPDDLMEAVRDLARVEMRCARSDLRYRQKCAQLAELEGEEDEEGPCLCLQHLLLDDETFSVAAHKMTGLIMDFGDDYDYDLPNGFGDYQADGKSGAALVEHIKANLETRNIKLLHSINLDENDEGFEEAKATTTTLRACLLKFISKAEKAADEAEEKLIQADISVPESKKSRRFLRECGALQDAKEALADARRKVRLTVA